jgi:hypothetical protein
LIITCREGFRFFLLKHEFDARKCPKKQLRSFPPLLLPSFLLLRELGMMGGAPSKSNPTPGKDGET